MSFWIREGGREEEEERKEEWTYIRDHYQ